MKRAACSLLVLSLALLVGCVETTFMVGRVEDAKIDATLLGRWAFDEIGPDGNDRATLDVAKFDEHRYRLEWTALADGKVMKMAGHIGEVKGVMFVHAAALDAQDKPSSKHYLIRIDRDGNDAITLSNLNPDFLAGKRIDSDAALRATLEASLEDPNLYVADVLMGKRAK